MKTLPLHKSIPRRRTQPDTCFGGNGKSFLGRIHNRSFDHRFKRCHEQKCVGHVSCFCFKGKGTTQQLSEESMAKVREYFSKCGITSLMHLYFSATALRNKHLKIHLQLCNSSQYWHMINLAVKLRLTK